MGVIAAVTIVSLAPSLYEVVERGRLVPYSSAYLYRVRVLDAFTVYASEEMRPSLDKLSAVGLVGAATTVFMALLLLRAACAAMRLRRFLAFASAGLAFFAADELFGIHETIGHNLPFLADLPGVERPDDVVVALYTLPLALFAWSFRDVLRPHRRAVQVLGVGFALFAVAVVGDVWGRGIDEPAEVLSAGCVLAGLVTITATVLRRELDLDGIAARRADPPVVASEVPDDDYAAQAGALPPAAPVA